MKQMRILGIGAILVVIAMSMSLTSCSNGSSDPTGLLSFNSTSALSKAGTMDAYYDDKVFTINFKEMPSNAEQSTIDHNKSINTIYMSDAGLPGGQMFIAVLDAIQGDGFNPLWREVQVNFNAGHTPHQFTSDTDILAAQASGEITLQTTNEVYRCSVIGPKK